MADVEVAVVFNSLDRIGDAVWQKFRRHVDVVLRADHHGVTGNRSALGDFDADRLKQDLWLDVLLDKEAILGVADTVSGFDIDKSLILCF